MRILIDFGCYDLMNQGDAAMLMVTVQRLHERFPVSRIGVFTTSPERLELLCPNVFPVDPDIRNKTFAFDLFSRWLQKRVPASAGPLSRMEEKLWVNLPGCTRALYAVKRRVRRSVQADKVSNFFEYFLGADLVVASGGGYVNDHFGNLARGVVRTLFLAGRMGKKTLFLGQGFSRIEDPALLAQLRDALAGSELIGLREDRVGPALLDRLGIDWGRAVVTGDDAVELAYDRRAAQPGTGLGINLRFARYARMDKGAVEGPREVLREFVREKGAELIPVPISFYREEPDWKAIKHLLEGIDDLSDGGRNVDHPLRVIDNVSRCRVVLTSSYHPAVFALSQGIPAVALVKSGYYREKFEGLRDQFGGGCELVELDEDNLDVRLRDRLEQAWNDAPALRPGLLTAARRQIRLGRAALMRIRAPK
jgi:polysaccharide pyruvyl transferase WcaK-like protein